MSFCGYRAYIYVGLHAVVDVTIVCSHCFAQSAVFNNFDDIAANLTAALYAWDTRVSEVQGRRTDKCVRRGRSIRVPVPTRKKRY